MDRALQEHHAPSSAAHLSAPGAVALNSVFVGRRRTISPAHLGLTVGTENHLARGALAELAALGHWLLALARGRTAGARLADERAIVVDTMEVTI